MDHTSDAFDITVEIARKKIKSDTQRDDTVFLLQMKYTTTKTIDFDARNAITTQLTKNGFQWIDASASRVIFKVGSFTFEQFEQAVRNADKMLQALNNKDSSYVTRILHIIDPGLGICLAYPEDLRKRLNPVLFN